jgi:beta-phosphoglucomutase-like phosphatase (HAD superfamily)
LQVDPQVLCRRWRAALNASEAGLASSGKAFSPAEQAARRERIAADRVEALRLITAIARERGRNGRFLHLRSTQGTRQLLGLREGIAACVFDLEGVLIAGTVLHVAAWTRAFDDLTLGRTERTVGEFRPFDPHTDYRPHLQGKPRLDGVRSFLASRGISLPEGELSDPPGAETVHGLANRKQQALLRLIDERGVTAFEGSGHYLDFAGEVGVRTAVVSASANTQAILRTAGLEGRIDAFIDGNAITAERLRVSPAPDTLLAACRALAVEPRAAVAFETSPAGVTAARAAGFASVLGVDEGGRADGLLTAGAAGVVQGLAGLLERGLAR